MSALHPAPWTLARWAEALRVHPWLGVFKRAEHARFYSQLQTLLATGAPLPTAFAELAKHADAKNKASFAVVSQALRQGASLASSLRAAPTLVDPTTLALVEAAEVTGTLVPTLARRTEELREIGHLTARAALVSLYPAFLVALGVFVLPLFDIAPTVGGNTTFSDMASVYRAGLARNIALLALGAGALFFFPLLTHAAGWNHAWDNIRLGLPGLGGVVRRLYVARLCSALGSALGAGLEAGRSVGLALASTESPTLIARAPVLERAIRSGSALTEVLGSAGIFDGPALSQLSVGERSGDFPRTLGTVARDAREQMMRRLSALMFSLIGILLASLLGLGTVAVVRGYSAYWKTLNQISK
ncbi:MAG: type II secretion system F family protein [Myxococcaceae bacterium]